MPRHASPCPAASHRAAAAGASASRGAPAPIRAGASRGATGLAECRSSVWSIGPHVVFRAHQDPAAAPAPRAVAGPAATGNPPGRRPAVATAGAGAGGRGLRQDLGPGAPGAGLAGGHRAGLGVVRPGGLTAALVPVPGQRARAPRPALAGGARSADGRRRGRRHAGRSQPRPARDGGRADQRAGRLRRAAWRDRGRRPAPHRAPGGVRIPGPAARTLHAALDAGGGHATRAADRAAAPACAGRGGRVRPGRPALRTRRGAGLRAGRGAGRSDGRHAVRAHPGLAGGAAPGLARPWRCACRLRRTGAGAADVRLPGHRGRRPPARGPAPVPAAHQRAARTDGRALCRADRRRTGRTAARARRARRTGGLRDGRARPVAAPARPAARGAGTAPAA
jgi:hypothetical protein